MLHHVNDVYTNFSWPTLKYYTDWHDVDEETRTAIARGGYWCRENEDGVTRLNLDGWNTPTTTRDIVAYKDKNSTPVLRVEFYMSCLNLWICQITEE